MDIFSEEQTIFNWGEAGYPSGGRYGPRSEPFLCLLQIFKGDMEIIIDGKSYLVKPGEIVLVCNEKEVDYLMGEDSQLSWVEIPRPPIPHDSYIKIKDTPYILGATIRLMQLMDLGLQVNRKGIYGPTEFKNALGRAIFHEFFDQLRLEFVEKPLPDLVKKVKHYIEDHYTAECDTKSISEYAGVSQRYLFKVFRDYLDSTPVEYLWQLRLNKGVELIYFSGLKISEIAYQCGFKNPYHFSRYVRQHYGISPSKLRKVEPHTYRLIIQN